MERVGGSDSSSGARIISNGNASCTAAQSEPSPGPASAAAHAAAENGGKQNIPAHSTCHGGGDTSSGGDDISNERLDRKEDHHAVSDHEATNGGGPIPAIRQGQGVQQIRHSGVRTKFIVESLRMEMITLQRQNAKLRRIVAMRLPDRSDVIFEDCCSVSASKAVAARESFVKKMTEELANLGVGGDDSDDGDDDDEIVENIHLYVTPDDGGIDAHDTKANHRHTDR